MVDTAKIKEVRERTGVGFGDCRKALNESEWDVEKAIEYVRKQSSVKAAKKADRTAAEGRLAIKVSPDGNSGAIVEVNVETDFAARNARFAEFCETAVSEVLDNGADALKDLDSKRQELIQSIGENVTLRRADRFESESGLIASYLHTNGTVGALVEMKSGDADAARDVAMHVTASAPLVVAPDDLPSDIVDRERKIFFEQAKDSGKPDFIVEKMVEGRLRKFRSENCLLEQSFIKQPDQTMKAMLKERKAECARFVRFEVGEGIDRKQEDFAGEVQDLL